MPLPAKDDIQQVIDSLNSRYFGTVDYELSDISWDVQPSKIIIFCQGKYHLGNAYDLARLLGNEDIMADWMPDDTGYSQVVLEEKEVWLERNKS